MLWSCGKTICVNVRNGNGGQIGEFYSQQPVAVPILALCFSPLFQLLLLLSSRSISLSSSTQTSSPSIIRRVLLFPIPPFHHHVLSQSFLSYRAPLLLVLVCSFSTNSSCSFRLMTSPLPSLYCLSNCFT